MLTGGFAPRARVLRGLTLEQVGARPHGPPHRIYQELWHTAMWQKLTLDEGTVALDRRELEEHFPTSAAPVSQAGWRDQLVADFLAYSEGAVHHAEDKAWLDLPEGDGTAWTWRNGLGSLAVHTAYHLGKIVFLRQLLGV